MLWASTFFITVFLVNLMIAKMTSTYEKSTHLNGLSLPRGLCGGALLTPHVWLPASAVRSESLYYRAHQKVRARSRPRGPTPPLERSVTAARPHCSLRRCPARLAQVGLIAFGSNGKMTVYSSAPLEHIIERYRRHTEAAERTA